MPDPLTRLPYGLTPDALAAAAAEPDPDSPAASDRLRRRFPPELAAAAVTQVVLRRRAVTKFGDRAAAMFFTRDGLEQATRPAVAAHRAARLAATGVRRVVDLGCGIGTDAAAFAAAGLSVVAVERDPRVAEVARANLPPAVEVVVADAAEALTRLGAADDPAVAVFCDPARRTSAGRSWRVADLSPSWGFLLELLARRGPGAVKLGPGFPVALLPDGVEAEWVAESGDTVEVGLWSGPGAVRGRRSALVLPGHRLVADPGLPRPSASAPRGYLYEPVGAVTRAGALPALARDVDATVLHPDLAYLTADVLRTTPFATAFAVGEHFPYREKDLRARLRDAGVGSLEILTRGLDLDPALLRRRLGLRGPARATVIITRTSAGKVVLVAERVPSEAAR